MKIDYNSIEISEIILFINDEYSGLEIVWYANIGFGTFQYILEDNKFEIVDDEYMGKKFAQKVLEKAIEFKEI